MSHSQFNISIFLWLYLYFTTLAFFFGCHPKHNSTFSKYLIYSFNVSFTVTILSIQISHLPQSGPCKLPHILQYYWSYKNNACSKVQHLTITHNTSQHSGNTICKTNINQKTIITTSSI